MGKPRVIYWFRTDLRLHDSPALKAALDLNPSVLWPIFTFDPHYVYQVKGGANRWQFLLDCQNDLSDSIHKLNSKSKLFILREAPQTLLPKLFKAWNVTHLVFEKDTDPYGHKRDADIAQQAEKAGVQVIIRSGRTLWDSEAVVAANNGKPTMSIAQLEAAGHKVGAIPEPIPAPKSLPDPGDMSLESVEQQPPSQEVAEPDLNAGLRAQGPDKSYKPGIAGPKGDFSAETLSELGFPEATTPHRGGESVALKMLGEIISNEEYTATFEKPKTSPAAFAPQSTTLLSPFLHFGALSPRLFYHRVDEIVQKFGSKASKPPASLTGQLLFRDMYFAAQAAIGPDFHRTVGNSHCRFIPWHLPSRSADDKGAEAGEGDCSYHVDSPDAEKWFQRWRHGVTGFPFVDALMRQLAHEGWIHHLGRHLVACFLTRGGCYISWERGADVFAELLLDHEPACNAGNWQWLSCTAFFAQFYRCYSPVSFGQKWDKHGDLIRKWCPELESLDQKYIYEPWKAPKAALETAGVTIEGDGLSEKESKDGKGKKQTYPEPMFDFAERRTKCLSAMKTAYSIKLYGDDKRVSNGQWKQLFEEAGETEMESGGEDGDEHSDDDGEHADDAEHESHRKRGAKKQGPMDRHVKKTKT